MPAGFLNQSHSARRNSDKEMNMNANQVCASHVLSTDDLKMRTEQDLTEIVARFLAVGEGVVAHWVEYARGLLLFVMAPGDERSGEFYIYDRKRGNFWLMGLADDVFGGYCLNEMRRKIQDFRLLDFAENPARMALGQRS
jgi:hypothetical protein